MWGPKKVDLIFQKSGRPDFRAEKSSQYLIATRIAAGHQHSDAGALPCLFWPVVLSPLKGMVLAFQFLVPYYINPQTNISQTHSF